MSSQTKENYLKAIYSLAEKRGQASLSEISKELQVSAATANNMMQKLKKEGWIKQEKYKPITLTPAGKKLASDIIRKHRITEMFLTEVMGIGWEKVHHIAEQIEHVDSPLLFDRMDEMLNFPQQDPHGSPIPDKDGKVLHTKAILLSQTEVGAILKVAGVDDSSKALLEHLNEKNIQLGTELKVLQKNNFDQSMLVKIDQDQEEFFSFKMSNSLRVVAV